jgi:hypothetical protein
MVHLLCLGDGKGCQMCKNILFILSFPATKTQQQQENQIIRFIVCTFYLATLGSTLQFTARSSSAPLASAPTLPPLHFDQNH